MSKDKALALLITSQDLEPGPKARSGAVCPGRENPLGELEGSRGSSMDMEEVTSFTFVCRLAWPPQSSRVGVQLLAKAFRPAQP